MMAAANFKAVFNRNERRVIEVMSEVVDREGLTLSAKDMQDAYALALNNIPPHYVHRGTIVLHPNISTEDIGGIVRDVLTQVMHITKP